MLPKADVKIRRTIDIDLLSPMREDQAASENGLMLNHSYFDMRGYDLEDAKSAIKEEAKFLTELAEEGWKADVADEIHESLMESGHYPGWFDIGMSAAVFALSAAGAAPISSCNGGQIGDFTHMSDVPHVIFSLEPEKLAPILRAAETAEVGLINNGQYAELFADELLKLHRFAKALVAELAPRRRRKRSHTAEQAPSAPTRSRTPKGRA